MKTMAASEFKARCLSILDQVARTGERIVILKRGKPVAQLGPTTEGTAAGFPQDRLRSLGGVVELGDIVSPPLPAEAWDAVRGKGA
ncbi:MAG: type II toxin-antitoxin system Phd/YefM family antitoxin [Deltaproteobacteria bacterium]|nr:type II toxin-antitoxin system Phd/YefM family antitoxin [Deltaproteobacteria bacterium]